MIRSVGMNKFPVGSILSYKGYWYLVVSEDTILWIASKNGAITGEKPFTYEVNIIDTLCLYKDVAKRHGHLKALDDVSSFWFASPERDA